MLHNPQALTTQGATGLSPNDRFEMTDSCRIEMFPEPVAKLAEEIHQHPALVNRLIAQQDKDFYAQLSEIASYTGVVLDGFYSKADIVLLTEILTMKLYESRTSIILPA